MNLYVPAIVGVPLTEFANAWSPAGSDEKLNVYGEPHEPDGVTENVAEYEVPVVASSEFDVAIVNEHVGVMLGGL